MMRKLCLSVVLIANILFISMACQLEDTIEQKTAAVKDDTVKDGTVKDDSSTTAKTIVFTDIPPTSYAWASSAGALFGLFKQGTSIEDVIIWKAVVARATNIDALATTEDGLLTLTFSLYNPSGDGKRWTGSGTFDMYCYFPPFSSYYNYKYYKISDVKVTEPITSVSYQDAVDGTPFQQVWRITVPVNIGSDFPEEGWQTYRFLDARDAKTLLHSYFFAGISDDILGAMKDGDVKVIQITEDNVAEGSDYKVKDHEPHFIHIRCEFIPGWINISSGWVP